MTQTEKRCFIIICLFLIILAAGIVTRYYFKVALLAESESVDPSTVIGSNEIAVGFRCTTDANQTARTENGDFITTANSFQHKIYTADGTYITALTVTVSGSTSPSETKITHLSATLSDEQWSGLTVTEHLTGDTATVLLFQDQLSICHFQYRVIQDGTISYL